VLADGGVEAPEAVSFSIECPGFPDGQPPACLIRGHVFKVEEVVLDPAPKGIAAQRALALIIAPDDAVPCRTPLDTGEKALRLPEADDRFLERSGPILVLGGARIAGALREGAALCGWTRRVAEPGLAYPAGWEGELADGSGALLGASSLYFEHASSRALARAWQFSREGPVERIPIDEGGAFLRHRGVRIHHGGGSALSVGGAEVVVQGRDGAFAVTATSNLTVGNVPIFVGHHDGFAFAAVRLPATRE
jgi:hypothetical protein